MWFDRVDIAENERGLLFRSGNFVRVLAPGRHRFAGLTAPGRVRVDVYDLSNPVFEHPLAGFLVKAHPELRESVFQVVELGDHEVGLQFVDGRLTGIVPPATQVIYWRGLHDVRVEIQDISVDFSLPAERVGRVGHLRQANGEALAPALEYAEVEDGHVGLLLVNGRLERVLAPGSHAFWKFNRTVQVKPLDTRLQKLELKDAIEQGVRGRLAAYGIELGSIVKEVSVQGELKPSVSRRREVVRIHGEPGAG